MKTHREDDSSVIFTGRDVTEMVLRLAHEIRNPLATIKSSIQLIRRLKMSAETASPHLESALRNIERIHETMREIERFVSIQPGTPSAVGVEQAMKKAMEEAKEQAEKANIRLTNKGGPPVRVAIDAQQLQLVIGELLENALTFSEGEITIWWDSADQMVRIHVEDDGPGVAEKHSPHIMKPFYSTQTQGTGLGLNMVQRICEMVGGRMEWANRSPKGCSFTIVLREV